MEGYLKLSQWWNRKDQRKQEVVGWTGQGQQLQGHPPPVDPGVVGVYIELVNSSYKASHCYMHSLQHFK